MRGYLFLAVCLLAAQVCAEGVGSEVEEMVEQGHGGIIAKLGKVAQVNELDDESLIGLKEGAAEMKEVPVSPENPTGSVPYCEMPISTKYPNGQGPCSEQEAAKKAAQDEEEERLKPTAAQEARAATKSQAEAAEEEVKWDQMNKQIDIVQGQIVKHKTELQSLKDTAGAEAMGAKTVDKNDLSEELWKSKDTQTKIEAAEAKITKLEAEERVLVKKRAKVAAIRVDMLQSALSSEPEGSEKAIELSQEINKAQMTAEAEEASAKEIASAVSSIDDKQSAIDSEEKAVDSMPEGSDAKVDGKVAIASEKEALAKEEGLYKSDGATESSPLAATKAIFVYDAKSQKACCKAEPADWQFLDINNDGKNGMMASKTDCEAACRAFKGCKYFEMNPNAPVDWCTGFAACDRQCTMEYKRPHTIWQIGVKTLEQIAEEAGVKGPEEATVLAAPEKKTKPLASVEEQQKAAKDRAEAEAAQEKVNERHTKGQAASAKAAIEKKQAEEAITKNTDIVSKQNNILVDARQALRVAKSSRDKAEAVMGAAKADEDHEAGAAATTKAMQARNDEKAANLAIQEARPKKMEAKQQIREWTERLEQATKVMDEYKAFVKAIDAETAKKAADLKAASDFEAAERAESKFKEDSRKELKEKQLALVDAAAAKTDGSSGDIKKAQTELIKKEADEKKAYEAKRKAGREEHKAAVDKALADKEQADLAEVKANADEAEAKVARRKAIAEKEAAALAAETEKDQKYEAKTAERREKRASEKEEAEDNRLNEQQVSQEKLTKKYERREKGAVSAKKQAQIALEQAQLAEDESALKVAAQQEFEAGTTFKESQRQQSKSSEKEFKVATRIAGSFGRKAKEGNAKANMAKEALQSFQSKLVEYADKEKDLLIEKTECQAGKDCDIDQFLKEVKEKKADANAQLAEFSKKKAEADEALVDDMSAEKTAQATANEKRTKYVLAATTAGDDAAKEVQQKHAEDAADGAKICECIDGIAATGYNCPANKVSLCDSCDSGFTLKFNNTKCVENRCRCAFGSPIVARGICSKHGMNNCRMCDKYYTLTKSSLLNATDRNATEQYWIEKAKAANPYAGIEVGVKDTEGVTNATDNKTNSTDIEFIEMFESAPEDDGGFKMPVAEKGTENLHRL